MSVFMESSLFVDGVWIFVLPIVACVCFIYGCVTEKVICRLVCMTMLCLSCIILRRLIYVGNGHGI